MPLRWPTQEVVPTMFRVFGLDHFDLRDAASVALLEAVMNQVITRHYVSLGLGLRRAPRSGNESSNYKS